MPKKQKPGTQLYAVLIGINAYHKNPLSGCVCDVLAMDVLLREICANQSTPIKYKPLYLLAPNAADKYQMKDHAKAYKVKFGDLQPTFKNVTTRAFKHLKAAPAGSICVFYFSGHGSHTTAPEVFWHTKSDRQNETWVCVDSREKGRRDLIDKEIGYLLWDALKEKKDTHCVVITDSCHSGSSTRAAFVNDTRARVRHVPSANNDIPIVKYIGYKQGFYKEKNGKVDIDVARYVHLAACRDSEQAQESVAGGLFTRKLVDCIRAGAGNASYRQLTDSLAISVGFSAAQQNPVSFALDEEDLNLGFLGKKVESFRKKFIVSYYHDGWHMNAGQLHGIETNTVIGISDFKDEITTKSAGPTSSVLAGSILRSLDKDKQYVAVIRRPPGVALRVGIAPGLAANRQKLIDLKKAYSENNHEFFAIDFNTNDNASSLVQLTSDNNYILTRIDATEAMFRREAAPGPFLENVNSVGKWQKACDLVNDETGFSASDFVFKLERIEGQSFSRESIDDLGVPEETIAPNGEHLFSYVNDKAPAARFSIAISPTSKLERCHVGSLYLDNQFGIDAHGMSAQSQELVRGGKKLYVTFKESGDGRRYDTVPLAMEEGQVELLEVIKIIVASRPFNITAYQQQPLQMDLELFGKSRAKFPDPPGPMDWTVFTHRLRVVGPRRSVELRGGDNPLSGFNIEVPLTFTAKAYVANRSDILRKLNSVSMRSVGDQLSGPASAVSPPASIWGDDLIVENGFSCEPGITANNIEAIELKPAPGAEKVTLAGNEEIVIRIPASATQARSADDQSESSVVPYGYDETNNLFYPLGYQDDEGNVHILTLPPPSSGTLEAELNLKSVGSSIKLFFKRLFNLRKDINEINKHVLYEVVGKGEWNDMGSNPKKIKKALKSDPNTRAVLLVHGFTGDTAHMVDALKEIDGLHKEAKWVLTYDYENLANPISSSGEALYQFLATCGFGETGMPSLTIIAHSLGGVVNRSFIENKDNKNFTSHLVLVGVPSGGTEMAQLGTSVLGLISHALNVTGPVKLLLKGLFWVLKKVKLDPGEVLRELRKTSEFMVELRKGKNPGLRVSLIGGDLQLIQQQYDGDDPFLKRIREAFVKKVFYPGLTWALYHKERNDMVVTLESMKDIPYFDTIQGGLKVVASSHLAYFREKLIQGELLDYIKSTPKGKKV